MKSALPRYCQHFQFLKPSESLHLEREAACKFCFQGFSGLWLCLTKGCGTCVCGKNSLEHLISHLEESRRAKKFHSIFINSSTAEIRCVHCAIEIGDLDIPSNSSSKSKQDPFPIRVRLLPALSELVSHRITGQLQNSQGHRRISRGLVGIFSTKYNYSINTSLQFLAHCKFIKQLLLQLRVSQKSKVIWAMQQIIRSIDRAQYRAIHSNVSELPTSQIVSELLYQQFPDLLGYKRKDPFEIIIFLFNLINQQTIHYSLAHQDSDGFDEWDLFYKKNMLTPHYLIYDAIQSTLSMNYYCPNCEISSSVLHNIQFLKLNIPKKKRKVKEVEKELAAHRATSPVKNRRKSLINLFKEDDCPLTVPELIIELTKSPIHKEMTCQKCTSFLKKTKLHFQKLPDILIIQIARISKEKSAIDQTQIELSTQPLDMGTFTNNPDEEIIYDFQSAVCIEKGCLYPIVVVGQANKQKYVIRNEIVELSNKQKMNPYILCYKKRPSETAKQKLTMITDDLLSQRKKTHQLPDFWYLQLSSGIERPFKNQLVCKHNSLKPLIQSKMNQTIRVSQDVYEDLFHFYKHYKYGQPSTLLKKRNSLSPRTEETSKYAYHNQICEFCSEELEHLAVRRKKQKEYVLGYDKLKSQHLPYCMISSLWIKKWSNFLYNHSGFAYMPKGFPLPPPIDNKSLLDGNKCKANLVKNEDFKILNIYLWKFLKQLYGGGPQIRYKWKEGRQNLDEELISQIRQRASELKYIYSTNLIESPKKMITSLSFIDKSSFSESINESFLPHPEKPHEEEEILEEQL